MLCILVCGPALGQVLGSVAGRPRFACLFAHRAWQSLGKIVCPESAADAPHGQPQRPGARRGLAQGRSCVYAAGRHRVALRCSVRAGRACPPGPSKPSADVSGRSTYAPAPGARRLQPRTPETAGAQPRWLVRDRLLPAHASGKACWSSRRARQAQRDSLRSRAFVFWHGPVKPRQRKPSGPECLPHEHPQTWWQQWHDAALLGVSLTLMC